MGVNPLSIKTHRTTQGPGWCTETRVWTPAFLLWTRRKICDSPLCGTTNFNTRCVIISERTLPSVHGRLSDHHDRGLVQASLFEMTEPPGGGGAR